MALNNSVNIAKMGAEFPVRVVGKIGNDENGGRIRAILGANGLDDGFLIETPEHPTSTTQVLYVSDTSGIINRTFRHYFGAMGNFDPGEVDIDLLSDLRIVMVGYCLLLPRFDQPDATHGARIGHVLERLQCAGVTTCVDFVTPKRDRWWKFERFKKTLRWIDILSIGEDQAEGLTGIADEESAARALVETYGVGTAIVHCGDKGINYLYNGDSGLIRQSIFDVPPEEYAGNTGAGDAFTTGFLYGIHERWDMVESLKFATAAAAVSLGSLTCTDAMRNAAFIREYMQSRPVRADRV